MFRSKKKRAEQAATTPAETNGDPGTAQVPADAMPEEPVATQAPPVQEAPVADRAAEPPPAAEAFPAAEAPAAGTDPAPEPQPVAAGGNGAPGNGDRPVSRHLKLNELLNEPPPKSEEQRQQEAAAELMAAIAPAQQMLMEEVPDASSPDDAAHRLMERQNERPVLPDPEGERLAASDIYWADSSVYYRVRKHFRWGPQRGSYKKPWTPPAGMAEPIRNTGRGRLPAP